MTHPFEDRRQSCLADFQSALRTRGAVVACAARIDREGVLVDYELVVTLDEVRRAMVEPPHRERKRVR